MLDSSHSTMAEGTDVGIIGGMAVAVWFLILDTIAGHPFQTPSLLGQVVLFGDARPDTNQLVFGAILVYTAFHFAVFALLGMGLVVLVHWGVRDSVVRYALLPVFLVFEVLFYGLLEVFSERTNDALSILGGGHCQYLGRGLYGSLSLDPPPRFPGRSIRDTPLGDAPRTGARSCAAAPLKLPSSLTLLRAGSVRRRLAPSVLLVSISAPLTSRLRRSSSHLPPVGSWHWTRSSGCWDTTSAC